MDCTVYDHAWVDDIARAGHPCVEIRHSNGGTWPALLDLIDRGVRLRINGEVHSMMAFAAFIAPGSCFTDRAVFRFHAASKGGRPAPLMTEQLVASVPKPLQARLQGLTNRLRTITAREAKRLAPRWACSRGES